MHAILRAMGSACLGSLMLGLPVGAEAQEWSYIQLGKGRVYEQTAGGGVKPSPQGPFALMAYAETSNTNVIEARAVSPAKKVVAFTAELSEGPYFNLRLPYATEAALNADFPAGDYQISFHSRNGAMHGTEISLIAAAYPNPPTFRNVDRLQSVDPRQPLTIEWEPFVGMGDDDFVSLEVEDSGGDLVWTVSSFDFDWVPGANRTTVAAGILETDETYTLRLTFARITWYSEVDFLIEAESGVFSQTESTLRTQAQGSPVLFLGVSEFGVVRSEAFLQTNAQVLMPHPNAAVEVALYVTEEVPGFLAGAAVQTPAGAVLELLRSDYDTDSYVQWESFQTAAAAEARFPAGDYWFRFQPWFLPAYIANLRSAMAAADGRLPAPRVTNFDALQQMVVERSTVVRWDPWRPRDTAVTSHFIEVEVLDSWGDWVDWDELDANDTSYEIFTDLLEPGEDYRMIIRFIQRNVAVQDSEGMDVGYTGFRTQTEIPLRLLPEGSAGSSGPSVRVYAWTSEDDYADWAYLDDYVEVYAEIENAEPQSFQWFFRGQPLATDEDYVEIEEMKPANAGEYRVVVQTTTGQWLTNSLLLRLEQDLTFKEQPAPLVASIGKNYFLRAVVDGQPDFEYLWLLNGVPIGDSRTQASGVLTLALTNFQASQAGMYSVVAADDTGAYGESEAVEVLLDVPLLTFHDRFANSVAAPPVATVNETRRGENRGATGEPGERHLGDPGASSVWIRWQPPAAGVAVLDTFGSSFDTILAVYTGTSLASLTEVASNDDAGDGYASRVRFNAEAGTIYHVAMDGFDGEQGALVLSWNLQTSAQRLPLILEQPVSITAALGGTASFRLLARSPTPTNALGFQWLRNGQAVGTGVITTNQDGSVLSTLTLTNVRSTQVGTYEVRVSAGSAVLSSHAAMLELAISDATVAGPAPSTEDKIGNLRDLGELAAPGLAGSIPKGRAVQRLLWRRPPGRQGGLASGYTGTQIFSTYGSQTEAGEPLHCGVIGGASQWFSYQAPDDGRLMISTEGSDFDTLLAVYTGSPTNLAGLKRVACDDNSGEDGRDSVVRFNAIKDTRYFVAVDGVGGSTGRVKLAYVLSRLRLTLAPFVGGTVQVSALQGVAGSNYIFQASTNLKNWTSVSTNRAINTNTVSFTDSDSLRLPARYYRVVQVP